MRGGRLAGMRVGTAMAVLLVAAAAVTTVAVICVGGGTRDVLCLDEYVVVARSEHGDRTELAVCCGVMSCTVRGVGR